MCIFGSAVSFFLNFNAKFGSLHEFIESLIESYCSLARSIKSDRYIVAPQ